MWKVRAPQRRALVSPVRLYNLLRCTASSRARHNRPARQYKRRAAPTKMPGDVSENIFTQINLASAVCTRFGARSPAHSRAHTHTHISSRGLESLTCAAQRTGNHIHHRRRGGAGGGRRKRGSESRDEVQLAIEESRARARAARES